MMASPEKAAAIRGPPWFPAAVQMAVPFSIHCAPADPRHKRTMKRADGIILRTFISYLLQESAPSMECVAISCAIDMPDGSGHEDGYRNVHGIIYLYYAQYIIRCF